MMKVILNKCFGGFNVSDAAYELYAKKKGITLYKYNEYFTCDFGKHPDEKSIDWSKVLYLDSEHREDKTLIEVVEELGEAASGCFSKLVVVEIPDGMEYVIDDYDGIETLHARVQVW